MSSADAPLGTNSEQLFTRIIPGFILTIALVVSSYIFEVLNKDEEADLIVQPADLLELNQLVAIIIISLVVGEFLHLGIQRVSKSPNYFNRLFYESHKDNLEGDYILSPLVRRSVRKHEAAMAFLEDEEPEHPTLIQRITFPLRHKLNQLIPGSIYEGVKDNTILLLPDWMTYPNRVVGYDDEDFKIVFEHLVNNMDIPADFNNPDQMYTYMLYTMKDVESQRTKKLRKRYEAARNLKVATYMFVLVTSISVLVAASQYADFLSGIILFFLFLLFILYIVVSVRMTISSVGIEEQYVEQLFIEYILCHDNFERCAYSHSELPNSKPSNADSG